MNYSFTAITSKNPSPIKNYWLLASEMEHAWIKRNIFWLLVISPYFLHFYPFSCVLDVLALLSLEPSLEEASWMFSHLWEDGLPWLELTEWLEAKMLLIEREQAGWMRGSLLGWWLSTWLHIAGCYVWKLRSSRGGNWLFITFSLAGKNENRRLRKWTVLIKAVT